jgi:hypothetical protein
MAYFSPWMLNKYSQAPANGFWEGDSPQRYRGAGGKQGVRRQKSVVRREKTNGNGRGQEGVWPQMEGSKHRFGKDVEQETERTEIGRKRTQRLQRKRDANSTN